MDSASTKTPPPDYRADVITWSQTGKGAFLKKMFDEIIEQIQEGSIDKEELKTNCDYHSSVLNWNMFRMPEEIRDAIAGSDKVLVNMDIRLALMKRGDFVEFILGSYVKRPTTMDKEAQKLSKAFEETFVGTTDKWLSASIGYYDKMYRPSKHYGKLIVYVQSSGTGKSRTLDELSKHRPMLTVSFKDIQNTNVDPWSGWPPGDKPICQFFANPPEHGPRPYEGEELVGAVMGALMSVAAETLECEPGPNAFYRNWEIQGSTIAAFQGSERYKLFKRVSEKAEKMLENRHDELTKNQEECFGPPVQRGNDQGEVKPRGMMSWLRVISKLLIEEHARALQDVCEKYFSSPFILAFDECKELDYSNASLSALKRVIKVLDQFNIWHILVDTSPSIQDACPTTGQIAKSARLRSDYSPLPVFPYIQWDLMLSNTSHYAETPSEALEFDFLKRYGRPYWATLKAHGLLEAAKNKLLCCSKFLPANEKHVFAVFSARLPLELGESEASSLIAVDAVEEHMRILTAMANRDTMFTCAPSEPMLAVAAAAVLLESDKTYQTAMHTLVHKLILKCQVVDRGHQGKLLACILLTRARDAAIASEFRKTEDPTSVGCVNLADFLMELLGPNLGSEAVNQSVQQSWMVRNILTWAKRYHLNFTHFYQLSEHIVEVSPDFLIDCWRRGVAIACAPGQAVYDILLVVYSGNLGEVFDEHKFGLVSIQVKMRGVAASSDVIKQLTCPILVKGDDEPLEGKKRKRSKLDHWKSEHLVMLMDLGTTAAFEGTNTFSEVGFTRAERLQEATVYQVSQKRGPGQTWQGYLEQEPERYFINIRGSSSMQYPVIHRFAPALEDLWEQEQFVHPPQFSEFDEEMNKRFDPFLGRLTKRAK